MKKTKKSSRRGLEMLSSLVTKVIVLCLCMSLAMGTTVFASDDPSASGNGTSTSSDAGSADSSSDNSGSDNSGSDGSSSSTDSSSDGSSSTDNSGSDNSGSSDGSSSADNTNSADGSSSADNTNSADSSNTGTDGNDNAATSNDNADSSNNNADSSNDNADSSNNNADSSNDNAASSNDNADTSNTGTGNTTDPAAEQQEGSDGQNQQDAVQEEAPVVEQPAAEPVQGENLPPIETTPEQLEKVDAAIRTYSLMQTSQSQTTEESASEPITNAEALQKAIKEANGAPVTIVIGKGFTLDETITIPKGANITLVLDGKTLTGSVDTMFKVEGILNVYDNKADEIPADQNTGDQNGNSGSTTTETPSVPSSSGSNRGGSKVVVANDTPTTPPESKEGEDAADNSSSLTDAIKNWVEQKNTEPTEGQTQKEKDKADQQAKDQLLKDVGTITTEKAVDVIFNVVANGQLKLFGGIIKNTLSESVTGVKVNSGASFEMSGGVITGMTNSGVIVDKGSAAISGDAVIMDNSTIGNGGGIKVENGGTLEINGGLITGNEAKHIVTKQPYDPNKDRYNPENFNTDGEWKPSGKPGWLTEKEIVENNNKSGNGGGVYVDNSTLTMTGGEIYGNKTSLAISDYMRDGQPAGQGGGVYVSGANGKFDLSGGTISKNVAGEGGGIFIANNNDNTKPAHLTMAGGEVLENTAHWGEGGGIYIVGRGLIKAGRIAGNKTLTERDLGGGGIYIENIGELQILNAIVTNNSADGLGGGLSACVHGKTIVYVKNGAAIYGNTATGKNNTGDGHNSEWSGWNGTLIDGHNLWEKDADFKGSAVDIFTASSSFDKNSNGAPGIIVGAEMLGKGDANWTGYMFCYERDKDGNIKLGSDGKPELAKDENGNLKWEPVKYDKDGVLVYADRFLGVKAEPDAETIKAAKEAAEAAFGGGVWIEGNYSKTHGGGIANNGILTIGEGPFFHSESVDLDKTVKDADAEESRKPNGKDETFEFTLIDERGEEITGKNDTNGNVHFNLPDDYFTKEGEYTFTVKEKPDPNRTEKIDYDQSEYYVKIVVKKNPDKSYDLINGTTVESYTAEKVIYQVKDKDGEILTDENGRPVIDENGELVLDENGKPIAKEAEGIAFDNEYLPEPEEPDTPDPDPTPTPDPDPDPTPTPDPDPTPTPTPDTPDGPNRRPTTPDNTDVDIPESPTPLAETPEIDIPDPDVPLADTPEIEIPDPDVPLADVPRTGDAPIVLFGAALFCICGLFLARLRKITK